MKNLELPRIGSRNLKTAISVCICLILFRADPFYSAIASVICMQGTVENSVKSGINRLIGTLLGGVTGVILLSFTRYFNFEVIIPLITGLGIIFVIYTCNLIKKPASCTISCIVLIAIMIAPETSNPLFYASRRTIETALGILVAVLVNKYINPPEKKFVDTDNKNNASNEGENNNSK